MPILDAKELCKTYGNEPILHGVSLTIEEGERVGLVGTNGSGKSTLARLMSSIESPDKGELVRQRGARVAFLAQIPQIDPSRTALQEVLTGLSEWSSAKKRHERASQALSRETEGTELLLREQAEAAADVERLGGWGIEHRAESILSRLGVENPHKKLETASGGEQRRVALARILIAKPELAILDEPTNHLDIQTIEWLENYLNNRFDGALLLITHDRTLLDRVVQRTVELSHGKLFSTMGGYAAYVEAKAQRLAHQARVESNRQNFLRRELEWLRQGPKARTTKQKARTQRAMSVLGESPRHQGKAAKLELDTVRSGKTIVDLKQLSVEVAGNRLISGLDLSITKGERIGVFGPNGCGKTTLLKTIMGQHVPMTGSVTIGKNTQVAYLSQDRRNLDLDKSIYDNVAEQQVRIKLGKKEMDKRSYLDRFLFSYERQSQKVGSLSGGERSRVALAALLVQPANLVILDEPTNDLDVSMISALEQMLLESSNSALIVTHDRWFLERVATSIVVAEGNGRWIYYPGNYSMVQSLRNPVSVGDCPSEAHQARDNRSRKSEKPKRRRPLTYAERIELERVTEEIEHLDERIATLEATLGDPKSYGSHPVDIARIATSLQDAKEEVARLMVRWEELENKLQGDS